MARPRMTDEEYELWLKIKDNDFIKEQVSVLEEECNQAGIPLSDVNYFWYKSKRVSINAKNRVRTYDDVKNDIIKELDGYSPKYPTIKRSKITSPHCLVLDPSDIHIGKLAVATETGSEYNIKVAVDRALQGVNGIIQKASNFNFDKVLFIIGNDALHIDHPHRKTTAGTPQDTDGMWHEAFHAAKKMYVSLIEMAMQVADVHVVFNPSNHDYTHGYFLADTLQSWFRNSSNVTFDVDIIHRKYFKYGLNMIETDHGDGCKPNETPMLMAHEQPKMWAECPYRYSYKHHLHHKIKMASMVNIGKDLTGVTIDWLRSPSAPDGWHNRNGFVNMPAVEGFVHDFNGGRVAHFTEWF